MQNRRKGASETTDEKKRESLENEVNTPRVVAAAH
jgi:hypothetical protein